MTGNAVRRMGPDEFLSWIAGQDLRYELVSGEPLMMAGANRRHDRIAARMQRSLGNQLEGRPCRPFTSDTAVRIPGGNVRFPDLGVDCGPFDDDALDAAAPTLVVEILSDSTRAFDHSVKTIEYQSIPSLRSILLIDPEKPECILHARDDGGPWTATILAGLDQTVTLPALDVTLTLADIYQGLTFRPRPVLVERGEVPLDR